MTQEASSDRMPAGAPSEVTLAARSRFDSFDELASSIEDARVGTYVLSRESRPWQRTALHLGECLLQQVVDGASHVTTGRMEPDRVGFLLSEGRAASLSCNGQSLDPGSIFAWGAAAEVAVLARAPGSWLVLTAPPAALDRTAAAAEWGPAPAREVPTGLLAARREEVAALRALLAEATATFERAGEAGLAPEAARQLGEDVLRLVAGLAAKGPAIPPRTRRARVDRGRVVSRVEELFAASSAEPVYISNLSAALGVPERTLRLVFAEQYGAGPTHVLRCRRLCQAYRALREAPPGARVGGIAARFGFRHLGQFAADYRALFGERPSKTLRRAPAGAADIQGLSRRWLVGLATPDSLATA